MKFSKKILPLKIHSRFSTYYFLRKPVYYFHCYCYYHYHYYFTINIIIIIIAIIIIIDPFYCLVENRAMQLKAPATINQKLNIKET